MVYLQDNDKKFIESYVTNINENYAFKETECEMRAGLAIRDFEGITNQITLPKFRKLTEYFDNLKSNSTDITSITHSQVLPSLDITFPKPYNRSQPNINLNESNLRFTLNGRQAITSYCSTNNIPKYNESQKNIELIFKDELKWTSPAENTALIALKELSYKPARLSNDSSDLKANIDLSSIRTRIGGKVELEYNFKEKNFSPSDVTNPYLNDLTLKANEIYRPISRAIETKNKIYRFKKRKTYTIQFKDAVFKIDLTTVKSSKQKSNGSLLAVRNFVEAEVAEQEETYEYEIEFDLNGKDYTVLLDFIEEIYIPSFIHTNIHPSYTILPTQKNVLEAYKNVVAGLYKKRLIKKIEIVNDAIRYINAGEDETLKTSLNKTYTGNYNFFNLIKNKKESELNRLKQDYNKKKIESESFLRNEFGKSGMFRSDTLYFISPKVVSIELNNIREDTINSIRDNYTVTDKADGYSMMLIKFSKEDTRREELHNRMFLIDSNLRVYDTGVSSPEGNDDSGTMLLNGEYLEHDNTKKNRLNKYGIFDCYIYDNQDVCEYPLMSNDDDEETRLSFADKFFTEHYELPDDIKDTFSIFIKKFHMVNDGNTIFHCANTIWSKYIAKEINPEIGSHYYLDGLIFTHARYPVGFDHKKPDFNLRQNTGWESNLKWKPPEDNTIDFLVRFEKEEVVKQGNRVITKNKIKRVRRSTGADTTYDQYIVANLYNGDGGMKTQYNPQNSDPNICFKKNNIQSAALAPVLFTPSQPNIPNVCQILIPVTRDVLSGKLVTKDEEEDVIDDDTIIEVSYTGFDELSKDYEPNPNLRWNVLRTRHDKTFNYRGGVHNQKRSIASIKNVLLSVTKEFPRLSQGAIKELITVHKLALNIPNYNKTQFSKELGPNAFNSIKNNKELIESYFKSYDMIKTNINFGNHRSVANNIWRSIYNPVTKDMITSGSNIPNLSEEEKKYYNRDVKRDKSITLAMQDFHNKVIKNRVLLGSVCNTIKDKQDTISLLDLACGKGGDLPKWRDNNVTTCVGIDYIQNNIDDEKDGACARYKFYKSQSQKQGTSFPKSYFIVGDVGKSMNANNYIQNRDYKELHNLLWKSNEQISTNFEKNKFDVVSVMFALHYFFSRKHVLDTFIDNVTNNLKPGGYFIGCCFDGTSIFNKLKKIPKGGSLDKMKNGRIMWKIIRNYSSTEFENNDDCLGKSIKVYISSINQVIEEYLVNFDYLKQKLAEKGLIPVTGEELKKLNLGNSKNESIDSFKEIFNQKTNKDIHKITSTSSMSDEEKELSFMFKYFIFKKNTSLEETQQQLVDLLMTERYSGQVKDIKRHSNLTKAAALKMYDSDMLSRAIQIARSNLVRIQQQDSEEAESVVSVVSVVEESEHKEEPAEEHTEEQSADESKMEDALTVKGTSVVVNAPSGIKKKIKLKKDFNQSDAVKKMVTLGEQLIRKLKNPQTYKAIKDKLKKAFAEKIAKLLVKSPELQSNSELYLIGKRVSEA